MLKVNLNQASKFNDVENKSFSNVLIVLINNISSQQYIQLNQFCKNMKLGFVGVGKIATSVIEGVFKAKINIRGDSHESAYMEGQRSVLLFIKNMLLNDKLKGK